MICRIWHGWTTVENADAYERLLRSEIFENIVGREIAGFQEIDLLRRPAGENVEFVTIMWFDSIEAVRSFAGDDYEAAVVPRSARALLTRFDERSSHYEVPETRVQAGHEPSLRPIGFIRSTLHDRDSAPRQGSEGAPDAWVEVEPQFARALSGIAKGDELAVITWLHRADRAVLVTHPRNDPNIPLAGVFATRSPDRPNPLGLHRVTVRDIAGNRLRVGPIEAIDGTPVVDIKPVLDWQRATYR